MTSVFFEPWFKTQFYPKVALKLEQDLADRAREKERNGSILSSLGDRAGAFLVNQTKGLQSTVVYESVLRNSSPLHFADKGIFLCVDVNVGTNETPCRITFWGIHDVWILAPYMSLSFDNTGILQQ